MFAVLRYQVRAIKTVRSNADDPTKSDGSEGIAQGARFSQRVGVNPTTQSYRHEKRGTLPTLNHILGLTLTILLVSSMVMSASSVLPAQALAAPVIITNAYYGYLGSYNVVIANLTNIWTSSLDLVVFAVWKNNLGQTVEVTTGGLTLASGASGTAFAPLASQPLSGTYTVNVFTVTTPSDNPVSPTFQFSVTI